MSDPAERFSFAKILTYMIEVSWNNANVKDHFVGTL